MEELLVQILSENGQLTTVELEAKVLKQVKETLRKSEKIKSTCHLTYCTGKQKRVWTLVKESPKTETPLEDPKTPNPEANSICKLAQVSEEYCKVCEHKDTCKAFNRYKEPIKEDVLCINW